MSDHIRRDVGVRQAPVVDVPAPGRPTAIDARRLQSWLDRWADDRRAPLLGVALAALVLAGMLVDALLLVRVAAFSLALVALVSPAAGFAGLIVLIPMREPDVLGPLGVIPTVLLTAAVGLTARAVLSRRVLATSSIVSLTLLYLGISAYQLFRVLGRVPDAQERFALGQYVEVASGLLLLALGLFALPRLQWQLVAVLLVATTTLVAVLAVVTFVPGLPARLGVSGIVGAADTARAVGPFANPNYLGLYLAMGVVAIAAIAWDRVLAGPWVAIALAVVTLGLLVTFSRGAMVAIGAGLIVLAGTRSRRHLAIAGLIVVVALMVAYPAYLGLRHDINFNGPGLADDAQAASDGWRMSAMAAGIKLWVSAPMIGIGFGQYHFLSPRFLGDSPITFSHNWYLNVLAEQGILGIAAYLALLGAVAWFTWRSAHPLKNAALAVVAALAAGSVFTESIASVQTTGQAWILVALVCAAVPAVDAGRARGWSLADDDRGGNIRDRFGRLR